jgi:NarL family two-component system response regulator LiaR
MAAPIQVMTGEFEDLVAAGLSRLLSEDASVELVARGVPIERIETAVAEHHPAVAVLDFTALPNAAFVYKLYEVHPETRVVVLANRPTTAEATQMLSFGAAACLSKETQARDVITAIHLASRGMNMLPRSTSPGDGRASIGPDLLTPREADVLQLLQHNRTNAEVANELSIGIETVRTHARNIYRKLGVASRRELARSRAAAPAEPL